MRQIKIAITILLATAGLCSCEKNFLQLPISNTTTVDSVFSTTVKADGAIANAYYDCLSQGLPYTNVWNAMIQENMTAGVNYGYSWTISEGIDLSGMTASGTNEDMDGYSQNFVYIRQAWLVYNNIDQVKDMAAADKATVKGEMLALIAYRYEQMF